MSATNQTTYYDLPLFIGTDVPSWLGDWNNTMNALDTAINGVKTAADSATNVANTAEGKSDANTESIDALNSEVQTLKKAVQNYDSILDFNQVNLALNPNNCNSSSAAFMVQNTNKTLSRLWFYIVTNNPLSNPTTYVYTENDGTSTWYELFTVEDNCFNLNQGSLPNHNIVMTLGPTTIFKLAGGSYYSSYFVRAWYDGATTHFGFTSKKAASNLQNCYLGGVVPVFLSGSVYNPDGGDTSTI